MPCARTIWKTVHEQRRKDHCFPSLSIRSGACRSSCHRISPRPWDTTRAIGFLIALFATIILFIARYQIGSSFTVTPQARALVTHGVYSRIRNPIYDFSGLVPAGVFISFHLSWGLLLLLVLIPVFLSKPFARARKTK